MKNLRRARERYDQTPTPPLLAGRVENALNATGPKPRRQLVWLRYTALATAFLCGVFVLSVNLSPAFASSVYAIPVLGEVARVVTFTEYSHQDDSGLISVKLPALQNTGNTRLERRINREIQQKMNARADEARSWARSYKDSFLAAGFTEEEYRPVETVIDYEIEYSGPDRVSFMIVQYTSCINYQEERFYYNIDLESGEELTLKDLLGKHYREICDEQIRRQIEERKKDPQNSYFDGDMGFTSIRADQPFYLNEKQQVVVVFAKYAIAPGYMGVQEFVIEP
ncbi:anti-sigma-V factor rsiV [Neobittarella massiliensis]|uniref:DUF3298 domain-containing protein n=1 Tax=Neobittarella massiliensis (ex Bilen et al. 2018) TaxID=2041842 RepID=A0A8J6LUB0_9FIRM|nr:anti-sigma-V factor rsiV [Neobittarella massiliensis]MBC3515535.1 DUF3298 domain-containing protein [Neobittarella massiliensis]